MSWHPMRNHGPRRNTFRFMEAPGHFYSARGMSTYQRESQRGWNQYYNEANGTGRGATGYNDQGWEKYYENSRPTNAEHNDGNEANQGWGYVASEGEQEYPHEYNCKCCSQKRDTQNVNHKEENKTGKEMDKGQVMDNYEGIRLPHHGGGTSTRGGRHHQGYNNNFSNRAMVAMRTARRDALEAGIDSDEERRRAQKRGTGNQQNNRPSGRFSPKNRGHSQREQERQEGRYQLQEYLEAGEQDGVPDSKE